MKSIFGLRAKKKWVYLIESSEHENATVSLVALKKQKHSL